MGANQLHYRTTHTVRQWCIGNIEASQALAPGSTPGWRILFFFVPTTTIKNITKQPIGGIEPPTFRLQSECSTTKLNRLRPHFIPFQTFRGSIVVSIPACHAGDPGSIPGLGVFFFVLWGHRKKRTDHRGNRTPNLRVWNPTRCHCAM